MSVLLAIDRQKHELRIELVKRAQRYGRTSAETLKVYRKILELQKAEAYLRRAA